MSSQTVKTLRDVKMCSKGLLQYYESKTLSLARFLHKFLPLANQHSSDFLSEGLWNCVLPHNVVSELETMTLGDLNSLLAFDDITNENTSNICQEGTHCAISTHLATKCVVSHSDTNAEEAESLRMCSSSTHKKPVWDKSLLPNWTGYDLDKFVYSARKFTLPMLGVLSSTDEIFRDFNNSSVPDSAGTVHISHGMADKKSHEIERMGKVCAQLAHLYGVRHVVDIGSGRGYLGCQLALQHQLNVLGVEGEHTYTESAMERTQQLQKLWPHLMEKSRQYSHAYIYFFSSE